MRLITVRCPKCSQVVIPPKGRENDEINVCSYCHIAFIIRDGKPIELNREIGKFEVSSEGQKVYLPFWIVRSNIKILREVNLKMFGSRDRRMEGTYDLYVLATEHSLDYVKKLSQTMTLYGPKISRVNEFETERIYPVKLTAEDAKKVAEFLFITYEGEKPGILQQLEYVFKVEGVRIFYAPFYEKENKLNYGFSVKQ